MKKILLPILSLSLYLSLSISKANESYKELTVFDLDKISSHKMAAKHHSPDLSKKLYYSILYWSFNSQSLPDLNKKFILGDDGEGYLANYKNIYCKAVRLVEPTLSGIEKADPSQFQCNISK